MNKEEAIKSINELATQAEPFLFISDYKGQSNHVISIQDVDPSEVLFDIQGHKNFNYPKANNKEKLKLKRNPIDFENYRKSFDRVQEEIAAGNTYLLNLTFPTAIENQVDLIQVFYQSKAKYKLWIKDKLVVYSPEIFIKIEGNKISSFPMKGTIDATLEGAEELILASEKEMAEHATIVDLIRNDMSVYASHVEVEKFRYIDEIKTSEKHLLQVSSKISGRLPDGYQKELGDLIFSLLPAGSICGAPKRKTLDLIDKIENYERGYYTGVLGYFDGENFDSGVMIRFIENQDGKLRYKSGGGIHSLSDARSEYQEMIDKVYVPIH